MKQCAYKYDAIISLFQLNLLDSKRSLNTNIFLRQFRIPHSQIIEHIAKGESAIIGAERLRGLLKILPEADEVMQ